MKTPIMEQVFTVYDNWIVPGTVREDISPGLTHNISCTVSVREGEWDEVAQYAWDNRHRIAAQSYLPHDGDKVYAFAPQQVVRDEHDEALWNTLLQLFKPVDYKDIKFLQQYIVERSKILPRRISGTCAKHQRMVQQAIKRARHIALLPFTTD